MSLLSLLSRHDAISQGLPRYYTGKPCKHGHLVERYVANYSCVTCVDMAFDKWYAANPDAHYRHVKKWNAANREQVNAAKKIWRGNNAEKCAQHAKKWKSANLDKVAKSASTRRARMGFRTPKWLTPTDWAEISTIYKYCGALRAVGLNYHVDHIVPLKGKLVSGLHVPWNLQVIPGAENVRKHNTWSV